MKGPPGTFRVPSSVAVLLVTSVAGSIACCSRAPPPPAFPGQTIRLEIGERTLEAEVVFDDVYRQRGLMDREELPENRGMLFIFPDRALRGFWMRDTLIPLSIAFIDDRGTILQIEDMRPKDESRTRSKHKVRYALEVNKGWFGRAGVAEGYRIPDFPEKVERFPAR